MKKLIYAALSKWFLKGCSHYNSVVVRRGCRSKKQAKNAFNLLGIPCAKYGLFYNPLSVFSFVKKQNFPVVIKPNIGGFSRGVHFPIQTYWQLFIASILVKIWWPRSIIEQYLAGKNYRVVVTKGQIMSMIRRHPPFVVGDGVNDISTLIDIENQIRTEMALLPIMSHIPKNCTTKQYLRKQKLNLSSVISNNEKIYLHHKISLSQGSIVEIIDRQMLTQANKTMMLAILDYFDANILGIDVICEQGLEVDFTQQKTIFLEVNSRPFLAMHDVPRYGEKEDLSSYIEQLEHCQAAQKDIF